MKLAILMPFYNSGLHFDLESLYKLKLKIPNTSILIVDDGSNEKRSLEILVQAQNVQNVEILRLEKNSGKGNALKQGFEFLLQKGKPPNYIAIFDSDFSSSFEEIKRLTNICGELNADAVCGCRIKLSGHNIQTDKKRFVIGRLISWFIRYRFKIKMYDSQCGYKVFAVNSKLENALKEIQKPSRWLFDVQLLLNLSRENAKLIEEPIRNWTHKNDSKIVPIQYWSIIRDLLCIK